MLVLSVFSLCGFRITVKCFSTVWCYQVCPVVMAGSSLAWFVCLCSRGFIFGERFCLSILSSLLICVVFYFVFFGSTFFDSGKLDSVGLVLLAVVRFCAVCFAWSGVCLRHSSFASGWMALEALFLLLTKLL